MHTQTCELGIKPIDQTEAISYNEDPPVPERYVVSTASNDHSTTTTPLIELVRIYSLDCFI